MKGDIMKELINFRQLPPLPSRDEILEILQREEYGFMPEPPEKISFSKRAMRTDNDFCGKGKMWEITITCTVNGKDFSFPVALMLPSGEGPHPFFINLSFEKNVPNYYFPAEEILDNGFGAFNLCYKDVTGDDGDFTNGLAGIFYPDGTRNATDCGKLALWAWAASRVLDYAETEPRLDVTKAAVCGHSRLGKTALVAGAFDHRFRFVHSNCSGCGGAAIARGNTGETVRDIHRSFSYWFCENYKKYIDNEENLPFDTHFLKALIAPRVLFVSEAAADIWANPVGSWMTTMAANEVYKFLGVEKNLFWYFRHGTHYHKPIDIKKLANIICHIHDGDKIEDGFFETPFTPPELLYNWHDK